MAITDQMDAATLRVDRMRFKPNSLSRTLALGAVVFNVFCFISLYKVNLTFYYRWIIGLSIVYNLVFMLGAFLGSEGVKTYRKGYAVELGLLGIGQIVRIFILPLSALQSEVSKGVPVMDTFQFIRIVIYLLLSAGLLITAAVIGLRRSTQLKHHMDSIAHLKEN